MPRALAVLGAVLLAHYAYPFLAEGHPDPQKAASWWFYILRGVMGAVVLVLLAKTFSPNDTWSKVGLFGCWLGVWEESQSAICGLAAMQSGAPVVPLWSGLCLEAFGYYPFALISATALLYLGLRHGRKN